MKKMIIATVTAALMACSAGARVWNGSVSTNWTTGGNWDGGFAPTFVGNGDNNFTNTGTFNATPVSGIKSANISTALSSLNMEFLTAGWTITSSGTGSFRLDNNITNGMGKSITSSGAGVNRINAPITSSGSGRAILNVGTGNTLVFGQGYTFAKPMSGFDFATSSGKVVFEGVNTSAGSGTATNNANFTLLANGTVHMATFQWNAGTLGGTGTMLVDGYSTSYLNSGAILAPGGDGTFGAEIGTLNIRGDDANRNSLVFNSNSAFDVQLGTMLDSDKLVYSCSNASGNVSINSEAILNLYGTTVEPGSYTILENANVAQSNIVGRFGTVNFNGSPIDTNKFSIIYGTDSIVVNVSGVPAETVPLTAIAVGNGTVSPTNASVSIGGSANFTVTAANYYRIASLTTNGTAVDSMSFDNNSTTTNFTWGNVQTAGVLVATFTAQTASDPAGTPYSWLAQYGLTNFDTDAVADQDMDGLLAWQEYIAGTDPTNAASCLKVVQSPRNVVSWEALTGRVYSVCWSTNLVSGFQALNTNILYPQNSYTNEIPDSTVNHYQIRVRLE